jgi:hypothetical protein
MAKRKVSPILENLQDQINDRIQFGVLLIKIQTLGAKLGFNVQFGNDSKKKAKPAKKAVKRVKAKRHISAAGRKRIAAAQKARWAKVRTAKKNAKKAAK